MAWGFEFGGKAGKLFLTLFRVVAVVGIIYWLRNTIKRNAPTIVVLAIALVLSGAFGNIIERVYGLVIGNGGKVTDFIVLGPIPNFNVADSLISVGLACLLFGELKSQK